MKNVLDYTRITSEPLKNKQADIHQIKTCIRTTNFYDEYDIQSAMKYFNQNIKTIIPKIPIKQQMLIQEILEESFQDVITK